MSPFFTIQWYLRGYYLPILTQKVHPRRLTWNIIMEAWKIIFLSKWVICRFHVNLPWCTLKKINTLNLEITEEKRKILFQPSILGIVSAVWSTDPLSQSTSPERTAGLFQGDRWSLVSLRALLSPYFWGVTLGGVLVSHDSWVSNVHFPGHMDVMFECHTNSEKKKTRLPWLI